MTETESSGTAGESGSPSMNDILVLPQELTIYTVGEAHPLWVNWLGTAENADADKLAEVQASGVEQIDTAGVQLLLSLQRGLSTRNRKLKILGASSALTAACDGLGLSSWLLAHSEGAAA